MLDVLEDIGLSSSESKIYLCLLDLGRATVNNISKHTGLYRTHIYDVLKSMMKKGIIHYQETEDGKIFFPAKPEELLAIMQKKIDELNQIMPQLKLKQQFAINDSDEQFIISEGIKSISSSLYGFLEGNNEIISFGYPDNLHPSGEILMSNFNNQRIQKKIPMKILLSSDKVLLAKKLSKMPYTKVRVINTNINANASTIICADNLLLVIWKPPYKLVRIKDDDISQLYRNYFYLLFELGR